MTCVAVQVGAAWLRVAADGRLVAVLPSSALPSAPLPAVLAGLFDAPVDELVVVHPAGRPAPPLSGAAVPGVAAVRAVPAAVAALAQHTATTGSGPACAVVVDVGHGGAEVAMVRGGRVAGVRHVPVGGARLDAVTARVLAEAGVTATPARARRVREALSLLPAVRTGTPPGELRADDLRAALSGPLSSLVPVVRAAARTAGGAPPVLLVGGVARTPLLAELLDAAGVPDVRVVERPDTAAVTGALRVPGHALPVRPPASEPEPPPLWLPPVVAARRRRSRVALATLAAGVGATALLAAGAAPPLPAPSGGPAAVARDELVQYGYAVRLPAGWAHTGGLPERRRSLLTPVAAPEGSNLITVERTPLGYDAGAEPQRARAELRARFAEAVAHGAPLSAFDDRARYAGRPVVSYRDRGDVTTGDVAWYVVLDGDAQLTVGCRHVPAGAAAVDAACAAVVGSLHRTD